MKNINLEQMKNYKWSMEVAEKFLLFSITFIAMMLWLIKRKEMCGGWGDPTDIWNTITSFYDEDRYCSYVLYKGFASVYPYVWFYQLARLLHTNDFFFIMCYHAILFAFISVIGIPNVIEYLTEYKAKVWQRVVFVGVLFYFWRRYGALNLLMVDLPSCAFFFAALYCALKIEKTIGYKKKLWLIFTGVFCGLCTNISGQYSISGYCVVLFVIARNWNNKNGKDIKIKNIIKLITEIVFILIPMLGVGVVNQIFESLVLQPFRDAGNYLPTAKDWLHRGLIYMLDIGRLFYGPQLYDIRGHQIVMDMYGTEVGEEILGLAQAGTYGWTVLDYIKVVFKYPVDFIVLYFNRLILAISDDARNGHLRTLLPMYTLVYLTIITMVKKIKKLKDLLNVKLWIVLSVLASMIPVLLLTVEMRYTISFQGFVFGIAVVGPIIPAIVNSIVEKIRTYKSEGMEGMLKKEIPWLAIGWLVFCIVCLGIFGAISAGSDIGSAMLYKW